MRLCLRSAVAKQKATSLNRTLVVVLGNQLFPFKSIESYRDSAFFMAEDVGLCTYVKHHQQKITLFLSAMRSYADALRSHGCDVTYHTLDEAPDVSYEAKLERFIKSHGPFTVLVMHEVEDKFFEQRMEAFAERHKLRLSVLDSPMFVTTRDQFAEYLQETKGRPFMARFYERQRKRLGILIDHDGKPTGGRWSFDEDNRQKLPAQVRIPETSWAKPTHHVIDVKALVSKRFADHPGTLEKFWLPTTREQALEWLVAFLKDRFALFGPYEDALSDRDPVLFHSVLSPMLNLGLLTPGEVLERALAYARQHDVPMNSLEGFIRQVIGWREFVRGIYQHHSEQQDTANHWQHTRTLKPCWYDGTTGMDPLDHAIRKARDYGWTHHIERLMVLANLMNLCEVHPVHAHRWFMEMYVDSSDWVMGPNVYGMGLMSDGGVFATKPYICGSNYILKMGGSRKGDWCDAMDGLYWRFIDKHRVFFKTNARMGTAVATFDKMDPQRKTRILDSAAAFIDRVTHSA